MRTVICFEAWLAPKFSLFSAYTHEAENGKVHTYEQADVLTESVCVCVVCVQSAHT